MIQIKLYQIFICTALNIDKYHQDDILKISKNLYYDRKQKYYSFSKLISKLLFTYSLYSLTFF